MSRTWRRDQNSYYQSDHNVICDRSGMKVKASTTRMEWTGLRVRDRDFEERHPQDFVRGRLDVQNVDNPRTEAADVFLSPGDVTKDSL